MCFFELRTTVCWKLNLKQNSIRIHIIQIGAIIVNIIHPTNPKRNFINFFWKSFLKQFSNKYSTWNLYFLFSNVVISTGQWWRLVWMEKSLFKVFLKWDFSTSLGEKPRLGRNDKSLAAGSYLNSGRYDKKYKRYSG